MSGQLLEPSSLLFLVFMFGIEIHLVENLKLTTPISSVKPIPF